VPVALKGFLIPAMLFRAMRQAEIKREVEPLVGIIPSLLLGAAGTGLALAFSARLPLLPADADTLLVPASLATVFTGFLMVTTRLKAISQVLGYLTLENGIFVFGLLLAEAMPLLLEFGVLLDLFVCIFVMGIILNHISREFSSLSTERLSALKE
jgi:hydrogenase-4 component E